MRIAHITATFPPYHAGTGNVCYHQARELARRGHTVDVLTASVRGVPACETLEGVGVRRLRTLVRVGNAPVLPGLLSSLRGYDLLHLHYPFILGAEAVRLAAALYRTPLVVSFHNDLVGRGLRGPLFRVYQGVSCRLVMPGAARLYPISLDYYDASRLGRSLGSRDGFAVEVPNGVDVDAFCPEGPRADLAALGVPDDARVVLLVAALDRAHHFKGVDRLLRALHRLPQDVWLVVVGDGDLRPAYQAEAEALGVAERTRFTGIVPDVAPYYRAAHVTVMPSSPPESFGLVLVESLACGTPVVAANIPGVRTVVAHGSDGMLVDASDPDALAGAIGAVLEDETERQAMGRRGIERVRARYAWPVIGDRLESLYREVLG